MTLLQTQIAQPVVDTDFLLPKPVLITDNLKRIFQTWLPNLLQSFHAVQMRGERRMLSKKSIIAKILNETLLQTRIATTIGG